MVELHREGSASAACAAGLLEGLLQEAKFLTSPTLSAIMNVFTIFPFQTTEVHLLPSMNPDGYVNKSRNNANDRDLNRGFPDWGDLGPPKFGPVEEHR